MSPVVGNNAAHAHLRSTLKQALGNNRIGPGGSLQSTGDGQDPFMHTRDDLADTGLDAGLVAQVGNILARLTNDHAGLLGGDQGAKSQDRLGILLVSFRDDIEVTLLNGAVHIGHGIVDDDVVVNLGGVHCSRRGNGANLKKGGLVRRQKKRRGLDGAPDQFVSMMLHIEGSDQDAIGLE